MHTLFFLCLGNKSTNQQNAVYDMIALVSQKKENVNLFDLPKRGKEIFVSSSHS